LGLAVVISAPTSTCGGTSLRGSACLAGITTWLFIYSGGALSLLVDLDWEKPCGLAGRVKNNGMDFKHGREGG